jgi:YidC/Oxa1 family membrane protein insertase
MDKKNMTIGAALLIAAFAVMFLGPRQTPPPVAPTPAVAPPAATGSASGAATPSISAAPAATGSVSAPAGAAPAAAPAVSAADPMLTALARTPADAAGDAVLANDFFEVRLTPYGGAIREVAFKQYTATQDKSGAPYVFNARHAAPILALADFAGLDQHARYERVSATATEVVYRAVLEGRLEVTRTYRLTAPKDPHTDPAAYLVRHETTVRNLAAQPTPLPPVALTLGTAEPVSVNDYGMLLGTIRFDGERAHFTDRTKLAGGGLLSAIGLSSNPPKAEARDDGTVAWAAVKNQFFTGLYTPDKPGGGVVTRRVELPAPIGAAPGAPAATHAGVTGALRLDFGLSALAPGATATLGGDLYVGPTEYVRLASLPHKESKVMQFDSNWYTRIFLSGYVAPLQNWLMNVMHRFVGNWGVAIILMTLLLKFVSLPFTLAASRSAKRMVKVQPLMQAIREKHKDNPQKLNQATMELFKEHKVNPLGGCLPILITMPLFVGFFTMLQGTSELRFQSFLWAHDLSAPDTIGRVLGIPINIMPLLMGATMIWQMRLTPSPTMDPAQATMMKIMPVVFTFICYNFSCALSLYSTINGLFTIAQQILVNKYMKDDSPAAVTVGPGGKPVKNVTPRKK